MEGLRRRLIASVAIAASAVVLAGCAVVRDVLAPASGAAPGAAASPAPPPTSPSPTSPSATVSPVGPPPIPQPSLPSSGAVGRNPVPGYVTGDPGMAVVTHGVAGRHRIALTFDSNMTDAMLRRLYAHTVASYANVAVVDELEARWVPATFFLAGKWVERYPELTRRIAADPNFELASHSYAHRGFTARCYGLDPLPTEAMAADVERSFAVLAPFGGLQTRYFRFPGGCYDPAALRAVAPAHSTVVQYDDVGDDPFNNDPDAIIGNVLRQAHDGAIVVLHITLGNAPRTADALPTIIDRLRGQGYQLVALSDLLAP